ncbi:type IX secretion system membrane protein PorP/SprF [uncultured Draconibacterium sp.]|uniref:PorP/SprF family type IX secretion system membrane protein n=1 Tax=uncultured Draconibacterium sp. TaxID=1573823 RepID=UPI0025F87F6D|nr:type IX secretion system membrane protein PorP/SprF [uncultured Draconibacterium sp.]
MKNIDYKSGNKKTQANMKTVKSIVALLLVLIGFGAQAQQDPLFSQYTFNKLLVNPGYAGSRDGLNITVVNRAQWTGIEGAPKTLTVSAHTAGKNNRVGLGFYVNRDVLGPTANNSFMGTYSYKIIMENSFFAFGLQGGLNYFDYDYSQMNLRDEDYLFDPENIRKITPDVNFGLYYQTPTFFAGLSSKHLLENDYGIIMDNEKTSFNRLSRHFYLMSGMVWKLAENIRFRPSTLVKFVSGSPLQIDINGSFLFKNSFLIGASFRTEKALSVQTELALMEGIRMGYSYDVYFNKLQLYNYGSHEIRLAFDINIFEPRMVTPRYF